METELDGLTITEAYDAAGISPKAKVGKQDDAQTASEEEGEEWEEDEIKEEEGDEGECDEEAEGEADEVESKSPVERASAANRKKVPKSDPPPPKEDPNSFPLRLAQIVDRAEWLAEASQAAKPKAEEKENWLALIDDAIALLNAAKEALSNG